MVSAEVEEYLQAQNLGHDMCHVKQSVNLC
jgi:hypothetical protein